MPGYDGHTSWGSTAGVNDQCGLRSIGFSVNSARATSQQFHVQATLQFHDHYARYMIRMNGRIFEDSKGICVYSITSDFLCSSAEGIFLRANIQNQAPSLPNTFSQYSMRQRCMKFGATFLHIPWVLWTFFISYIHLVLNGNALVSMYREQKWLELSWQSFAHG